MLFDTGAGITSVTPAFARRIGCIPFGSATGFRMRGDRLSTQKCGSRKLAVGTKALGREIAVFDLASLLPPDAPPIDGIFGLDVFDGRLITLSLSHHLITTDHRPGFGWSEGKMRVARELGGAALTIFAQSAAETGDLWLLLDTGHIGPVFLSPGALEQLGSPRLDLPVTLGVNGVGSRDVKATRAEGLIYDGVLGEPFLREFDIAVDLQRQRIWWRRPLNE